MLSFFHITKFLTEPLKFIFGSMWFKKCLGPREDALWVLHIILYGKMLSWSFMDQLWSMHTLMLEGSTLALMNDDSSFPFPE